MEIYFVMKKLITSQKVCLYIHNKQKSAYEWKNKNKSCISLCMFDWLWPYLEWKIIGDLFFFPYSKSVIEKKKIIKEATENIFSILEQFCKNSESKLIISSLSIPTYSPYGIFENKVEYSMKEMIEDFNLQLNCFSLKKNGLFLLIYLYIIEKNVSL